MAKTTQTFSLNAKEKEFCLELAKKSVLYSLKNVDLLKLSPSEQKEVPKKLLEKKACFVTLMKHKELRGCIGHLTAIKPLYLDIIENAYSAAFSDNRFNPVEENEFEELEFEVSVLTDPKELKFSDEDDLLKKIVKGRNGLIISKGSASATFLPSVWEQISSKEEFLSELCLKAGLSADAWREKGFKVKTYTAIKIK